MQGCTGLSAAGLSQLRQCKRLQYLDLSGTQVVGLGFLQLHSASEKGEDNLFKQKLIKKNSDPYEAAFPDQNACEQMLSWCIPYERWLQECMPVLLQHMQALSRMPRGPN